MGAQFRGPLGVLALCLLLNGCGDSRPPAERVEAFCSGIKKGEEIKVVLGRYEEFDLQPGGAAPGAEQRLSEVVDQKILTTISSALAEPSGSRDGTRPVCAIYYSNRLKGGDDKVILAEFKREWAGRY